LAVATTGIWEARVLFLTSVTTPTFFASACVHGTFLEASRLVHARVLAAGTQLYETNSLKNS